MKIKEVMEQTGLTDRAIRLYISNGLIDPQCERSYTGRNNYDFSNEDIELLRKIALLRKADFSLEQIRDLQTGGEEAVTAFNTYLTALRKEHERNEKVLHALQDFPAQVPTIEEVCRRLERSFQAEPTPKAVHDELPPHFHTPSDQTNWLRIGFDTLFHWRKRVESRSMTAHCHRCGMLITPPKAMWKYIRAAMLCSCVLVVSHIHIALHFFPNNIFLAVILSSLIETVIGLLGAMLLFGLCAWEPVPMRNRSEKEIIEIEADEANERRKKLIRLSIPALILMKMTAMFFEKTLGWG